MFEKTATLQVVNKNHGFFITQCSEKLVSSYRRIEDKVAQLQRAITFHQFGQISWVSGFYGDTHDRRHRELHDLHVVGILEGGDGTSFHQELIHTDKTANVTC